jgi:alpha-tubulin suppressor-like RCC1 family protein
VDGGDGATGRPDGAVIFDCASHADCIAPNAMTRCDLASTRCVVVGCAAGYGDCDLDPANGCEDDLTTAAHCGACGAACPGVGATCTAGLCENPIVQLSIGARHGCYRREDGDVYCWGSNTRGQFGTGDVMPSDVPVRVPGLSNAIDLASGDVHVCAIRSGGALECWGGNYNGQVANGTTTDQLTPLAVSLPASVVDVSGGAAHTCAVLDTGDIYCWGSAADGRLGDGTSVGENRTAPVRVMSTDEFVEVAASYQHTCARRADGAVLCWGSDSRKQLGRSDTSMRLVPSLPVDDITSARTIDTGSSFPAAHSCVIEADDTMGCWGAGIGIGYGSSVDRPYPLTPTGIGEVRDIGVGRWSTCAADRFGEVYCWGLTPATSTPTAAGLNHVTILDSAEAETCALREDQTLWCWTVTGAPPVRRPARVPTF